MKKKKINDIKRGDVLVVNLSPVVGSEQGGNRPVIVIQNNIGNKFSPTVIVASITSKVLKTKLPTHIEIEQDFGLNKNSIVLLEQLRTIDKSRIKKKIGKINDNTMSLIDDALSFSLGLFENKKLEKEKFITQEDFEISIDPMEL